MTENKGGLLFSTRFRQAGTAGRPLLSFEGVGRKQAWFGTVLDGKPVVPPALLCCCCLAWLCPRRHNITNTQLVRVESGVGLTRGRACVEVPVCLFFEDLLSLTSLLLFRAQKLASYFFYFMCWRKDHGMSLAVA